MAKRPRLSVVVPTHRRHAGVFELLQSCLHQTLSGDDAEIILVTNLPDPKLAARLESLRLTLKYPVELLVAERLGVNFARNVGLRRAGGEIALFLDDDCFLPRETFLAEVCALHAANDERTAARGGGYLSPANLTTPGRHYNWICNEWLGMDYSGSRPTSQLIGGAVSYNLRVLRNHDLHFDDGIVYGGAETEFHERMVRRGLQLVFHADHSVVHRANIRWFDLSRKAYLQGFGKTKRPKNENTREVPVELNYWKTLLRNSSYHWIYRRSFARGERDAQRGRTPSIVLTQWITAVEYVAMMMNIWRLLDILRFWRLLRGVRFVCNRMRWGLYGLWCESRGRSIRFAVRSYWRGYRSWRRLRGYGIAIFWYLRRRYDRAHLKIVRAYWTLYPVLDALRRSRKNPRSLVTNLCGVRMPFTYPNLSMTAEVDWVVRATSETTPQLTERWERLGVQGIDTTPKSWSFRQWRIFAECCEGLGMHLVVPAELDAEYTDGLSKVRRVKRVEVSRAQGEPEKLIAELTRIEFSFRVHIYLDETPQPGKLSAFFKQVLKIPLVESYSLELADVGEASFQNGFEYFRNFFKFSAQTEGFKIDWRPFYRFDSRRDEMAQIAHEESTQRFAQKSEILVSVIIPHHQDLDHLRQCLGALSIQTLARDKFEVLVIDNGVRESLLQENQTKELLRTFVDLPLRVSRMVSPGADLFLSGHARNHGLNQARGQIIQFLDSDIILPTSYLADLEGQMQSHDVLMAKRHMLKKDVAAQAGAEFPASAIYPEESYWEDFKQTARWTDLPEYWKYACTYCLAVRRSSLKLAGPFDPKFTIYGYEDVDLAFRLFKSGARFAFATNWVWHLFPARDRHNYHWDAQLRELCLSRSSLTFFTARPEKATFALCQGYFAPTLAQWLYRPVRRRIAQRRQRRFGPRLERQHAQ